MDDVILILIAVLAVYGFYSAIYQVRELFFRFCKNKNKCAKNVPEPFDKEP